MRQDDRKAILVNLVLSGLVLLSILYNTVGKDWVHRQWNYLRRWCYFENVIKDLPMHPARFWREIKQ